MIDKIFKNNTAFKIALFAAGWSAIISFFIQLLLLPYFFIEWHAGDGLLLGGDWVAFHKVAIELAQKINTNGWGEWKLRPDTWGPSGIAAAIYSITGINKPWVLIPMNAIFHGLSAMLLYIIIANFYYSRSAIIGTIPFIIFPSAMAWYASIHKDSFFILGCLLFIWSCTEISTIYSKNPTSLHYLKIFLAIFLSFLLVWIVRPYYLDVFKLISMLIIIISLANMFMIIYYYREFNQNIFIISSCFLSVFFVFTNINPIFVIPEESKIVTNQILEINTGNAKKTDGSWVYSPWIPDIIEKKLHSISVARDTFRKKYKSAGTNIDTSYGFYSYKDIIYFTPNAFVNSMLRPLPSTFLSDAKTHKNTLMRRVSGIEMMIVYIGIIGFLMSIVRFKNNWNYITVSIICIICLLLFALVITNIGTIYRLRYVFLLTIVGLGVAYLNDLLFPKKN